MPAGYTFMVTGTARCGPVGQIETLYKFNGYMGVPILAAGGCVRGKLHAGEGDIEIVV